MDNLSLEKAQNLFLPFILSWSIIFASYFLSWWLAKSWFPGYLYKKNNHFWYLLAVSRPVVLTSLLHLLFLILIAMTLFLVLSLAFPQISLFKALLPVKEVANWLFFYELD